MCCDRKIHFGRNSEDRNVNNGTSSRANPSQLEFVKDSINLIRTVYVKLISQR